MGTDTNAIGGFLLGIGVMQPWQVEDVRLAQHSGDARMFGEIAIALGYIEEAALRPYVEAHTLARTLNTDEAHSERKLVGESTRDLL